MPILLLDIPYFKSNQIYLTTQKQNKETDENEKKQQHV